MAQKIDVTVTPTAFTLAASETIEATASLRNLGQSVDQLTLNIESLDPSWYTLPVSSVALFPNDQDNLRIVLHPPAKAEAGSYPFRLKVISQENPEEVATVDLSIEIQALPGLELSISPPRITGRKGIYSILVNNMGNNNTQVHLKASDASGRLRYYLQPETLDVPGNGHSETTLQVRLGWLALLGGEREFDFQILATPAGVGAHTAEARTINGQFVRVPWHRTLPQIRIPWLVRPPVINTFKATTEDKREFKLNWLVKRATEVKLDDEDVAPQEEKIIHPTETTKYILTASNKHGSNSQTIEVRPLPVPKARISERIRVSFSPTLLQAHAGVVPAQAILQIQNLGEIVDKFNVTIEGLDEAWYSRSASSVALLPEATEQVQISFKPPKKKGVRSGVYPFAVNVSSQSTPGEVASVLGQLEILPAVEFQLKVLPMRVSGRRKGSYRVNLINTGITDITFALEATDQEEGCQFHFKTENPMVRAWNTIEVPMVARPKRGSLVGEKKQYEITVTATSDTQSLTAAAQLTHRPFIGSWRTIWRVVKTLIILAIVVVGLYFLIQLGGGFGMLRSNPQAWLHQLVATIEGWFRGFGR